MQRFVGQFGELRLGPVSSGVDAIGRVSRRRRRPQPATKVVPKRAAQRARSRGHYAAHVVSKTAAQRARSRGHYTAHVVSKTAAQRARFRGHYAIEARG